MRERLLEELEGRAPARWTRALVPVGWAVGAVSRARNAAFDRGLGVRASDLPVVSVGNLTVGGTSKTPMVAWLLARLGRPGRRLGVVSRGYSGRGGPRVFRDCEAARREVGDEPLLLSARFPEVWIAVDPDRVRGVQALSERGAELVLADDAFQHRRLPRCFDILLVDAARPFGNGRMIPAGTLREPPRGTGRADAVLLTRSDEADPESLARTRNAVERWVPAKRVREARFGPASWWSLEPAAPEREPELAFRSFPAGGGAAPDGRNARLFVPSGFRATSRPAPVGLRLFAFSAVARPTSFERTLKREGIQRAGGRVFPDHHRYLGAELDQVVAEARNAGADGLVCTEKDLPNLPAAWSPPLPLWIPRVELAVSDEPGLLAAIERAVPV